MHEPVMPELRAREPKVPVVLVPGITGTMLVEDETGEAVWGTLGTVIRPRGETLALPIVEEGDQPKIVAAGPVMSIAYGNGRRSIYDATSA